VFHQKGIEVTQVRSQTTSSGTIAWLSFATMFVIGTDTFLVAPMLPTLADTFEVSTDVSGWMVSAYALGFALFGLVVGPFSDGRDRRSILLIGFAGFTIATALCGVAQSFWMMIAFRLLAGVFAAFVTPQIWASIPGLVRPDQIVRTMGFAGAGMSVSQVVGVPIGGALAAVSWHTPFWVIGGLSAIAWLVLYRVFPSVPSTRPEGSGGFFSVYTSLFSSSTFRLTMLAYLVYQTGVFETFSFIGTWLHRDFGLGVGVIGICVAALGVAMALTSIFGSHVIKRVGERRMLAIGILGVLAAYSAVPFAPNVVTAVVLLAVGSAFLGINYPLLMSSLLSRTTAARGTVSSLATTALYAGTTVGGLVGGVLLVQFPGFFGVSGFSVVALALAFLMFAGAGAFRTEKATAAA
jgi:predicted MFS family arabinose efflux permease